MAVLKGPLFGNVAGIEQGLSAFAALALKNEDNRRLLGAAGACEGE